MRVREIMSAPPVTASPSTAIAALAKLMLSHRIGCVVIVADDDPRNAIGIVTRSDLQIGTRPVPRNPRLRASTVMGDWVADERQLKAAYAEAGRRPARDAMTSPVVTIEAAASAWDATEAMLAEDVGHLPVVDDGRLVGVVTRLDLLHCMLAGTTDAAPAAD